MKINFTKRQPIQSGINITPFTDVVLVLLIIFMITTPMIMKSGIKVNLPKSATGQSERDKKIILAITQDEKIYLNGQVIELQNLKASLAKMTREKPDSNVIVKADREIKYEFVIKILDIARQADVINFLLSVDKVKE